MNHVVQGVDLYIVSQGKDGIRVKHGLESPELTQSLSFGSKSPAYGFLPCKRCMDATTRYLRIQE